MPAEATTDPDDDLQQLAEYAAAHEITIATAESLTCGKVAARLGTGPQASQWLWGGVVSYHERVKFDVLGVHPGPVVTERCARQMAEGVVRLLGVDAAVATTGVGGPDTEEGEPAGTVYVAVHVKGNTTCRRLELEGKPPEVLEATVEEAVRMLTAQLLGPVG